MANRAVSISLYRAMWRWTATEPMRSARYAVPVEQLPLSVLASLSTKSDSLSGRAGAQRLIREAWRAGAALTEPGEIKQQLDGAFACLRIMGDFQEEVVGLVERRTANADRRGIAFQIGQVLRHRKYGFRGVVVGWDRRPQVDVSGWDGVQGLPSGPDQPFYRALPDMGDCVELLGGPRGVRCDAPPAPPWRDTPPQRAAPPLIASGTSPRRTSSQSRPRRTARSRMISCRTSSRTSTPSERPTAPCSSCACGTRPTTSPHPRRSQSCNSSGSTVWCVRRRRPLMPTRCSPDANPMQS